ncbi:hypothetical protein A9259_14430 [Vibrio cyclitrophicus]|uniref:hypothetical protein n=1 Tax=Vibrio cyclitrophicus TaxID=47951 RepID=UPI0007EEE81E|nr:hypothetical protein [Vibrio cyclitrophicus]OBS93844.1 hypothetical protein A9259_14430 [Vibrio cyclitrophicus]PMJ92298.1 hypothetical protein BCU11_06765 [Vibrio cyclitrophicus]
MKLEHICNVKSCIAILKSEKFTPGYSDPLATDSGLNCFIKGRNYNKDQSIKTGAVIHIEWSVLLEVKEVLISEPFPLTANVLYNQERWRAIIPAGTDRKNIKVTGFDITEDNISFEDRLELSSLKRKLPIYLQIGNA